jgi:hypothetical protein
MKLSDHLIATIPKGGHGFLRKDLYANLGIIERVHHNDHLHHQGTLTHKEHPPEIEIDRQKLVTQYWMGREWKRPPEPPQLWKKLGPKVTTGDADLTASLFVIVRAFGAERTSFRFVSGTSKKGEWLS